MSSAQQRILLIDAGNTRIKWGWLSGCGGASENAGAVSENAGDAPQDVGAVSEKAGDAPENAGAVSGDAAAALEWGGAADTAGCPDTLPFLRRGKEIAGALVCNVAGASLGQKLADLVHERLAVRLEFVQASASACGVISAYTSPGKLGADRWAALIGAHALEPKDYCIVDAGSTVTMDLLRADGRHLGGYIAPGREMSLAAMAKGTAELASRIKDQSGQPHGPAPGTERAQARDLAPATDSAEAMEKGTLAAQLGMIRSGMERLASEGAGSPVLLLTGGGADDLIATGQLPKAQVMPDLVLRGLAALAVELRLWPE